MKTLSGLKILITRPINQAENLTNAIQTYGGIPICFPTLEIVATKNKNLLPLALKKVTAYDFVIFLSPNAVFKTAALIHDILPCWPTKTKIVAIGPGTVKALKQNSLPADYYPEGNFSSESLLMLPILQNPKQKKILILQGEKGRGYLDKELQKKGAHVTIVNSYKRQCPCVTKESIPNPNEIAIIICTSQTGLKNLVTLLTPYWKATLFIKPLLVISSRIADYAKKLGFVKPIIISDNASNEAILQALWIYAKKNFKHEG